MASYVILPVTAKTNYFVVLKSDFEILLKPLFGRPGPPGLKCTSASAPT